MWYREHPSVWLWKFRWLLERLYVEGDRVWWEGVRYVSICLAYGSVDEVRTHRAVLENTLAADAISCGKSTPTSSGPVQHNVQAESCIHHPSAPLQLGQLSIAPGVCESAI